MEGRASVLPALDRAVDALRLIRDGRCPCGGRFKWVSTQCRCEQCGGHQGFENPHPRMIAQSALAEIEELRRA